MLQSDGTVIESIGETVLEWVNITNCPYIQYHSEKWSIETMHLDIPGIYIFHRYLVCLHTLSTVQIWSLLSKYLKSRNRTVPFWTSYKYVHTYIHVYHVHIMYCIACIEWIAWNMLWYGYLHNCVKSVLVQCNHKALVLTTIIGVLTRMIGVYPLMVIFPGVSLQVLQIMLHRPKCGEISLAIVALSQISNF